MSTRRTRSTHSSATKEEEEEVKPPSAKRAKKQPSKIAKRADPTSDILSIDMWRLILNPKWWASSFLALARLQLVLPTIETLIETEEFWKVMYHGRNWTDPTNELGLKADATFWDEIGTTFALNFFQLLDG